MADGTESKDVSSSEPEVTVDNSLAKPAAAKAPIKHSKKQAVKAWVDKYWQHKRWTVPVTVIVLLLIILGVPFTRYKVLGLFLKENVSVTVIDNSLNSPVSGVSVDISGKTATTNAKGVASLKVPVGSQSIGVSKQYYKPASEKVTVSLSKSHNSYQLRLVAIGRQVPITVLNKISGKPVAGAELKVLNTEAKTDQNGKATIVLPTTSTTQSGTLSGSGFNGASVKVQVTSQVVAANTFTITPAGSLYFLSNLSGKIDVVKTNLDGTGRATVLAGTGFESKTDTVLLASRDWKYLALQAQRTATGGPEIDLIDTSTDKMTNIDQGNATFELVGWSGDKFIYKVTRNSIPNWQSGQILLKSFDAPSKTLTVLDQTTASGNADNNFVQQQFGDDVYILNNTVLYSLNWFAGFNAYPQLNGRQATLNSVGSNGQNKTTIKSFGVAASTQTSQVEINTEYYKGPNIIAIQFDDGTGNDSYYQYQSGQVSSLSGVTSQTFFSVNDPTYLLSPSGNQTFWAVPTDGKNNLLVGDQDGNNGKTVATLSDYNTYGWYTDAYVLMSKNDSELYIMPATGGPALRITDYFKPSQFFNGYGGGYGGL